MITAPPDSELPDATFSMESLRSAADVARLASSLYGPEFAPAAAVLHVTAVAGPERRALKIDEHSPKSAADTFALNLARARADVIVITGKILRDEPTLSYAPGRPGPDAPALSLYRESLGKTQPPLLAIMTRGSGLSFEHPVFHEPHARALLFGPAASLEGLRAQAPCEVLGVAEASPRTLIETMRARGNETISFETGPSTSRELYLQEPLVDELCLSTFLGTLSPDAGLADPLPSLPPALEPQGTPRRVRAGSGVWSFERYARARPDASASI